MSGDLAARLPEQEREENKERQENEVVALKAIYDRDFSFEQAHTGNIYGSFSLRLDLGDEVEIVITRLPPRETEDVRANGPAPASPQSCLVRHNVVVRFLPPIIIHFRLPAAYPSQSPPQFALVCQWLLPQQLAGLKSELLQIWEQEKDVCLYNFAEHLLQKGMEQLQVDTHATARGSRTRLFINVLDRAETEVRELVDWIMDYDRRMIQEAFENCSFHCGVCLETKPGSQCFRLTACKHVFCRECVTNYFTALITEGSVLLVRCPDSRCSKQNKRSALNEESGATPININAQIRMEDLAALLPSTLLDRYANLLEAHSLSMRTDITYCPRPACQSPVVRDPRQEKLCICPTCNFAFCFYCQKCWHGAAEYCRLNNMEQIVVDYIEARACEDVSRTRGLEVRYGKKTLEKLAREWEEERETRKWKEENSQQCPTCTAAVQKNEGCNHMTCRLDRQRPYAHFNDVTSTCFRALFDDITGGFHAQNEWNDVGDDEAEEWFPDQDIVRMALEELDIA
ncbi:hypothetical protein SpCBS45565_g05303 [Spizellomyces sp. 'palustris']|nr:hypothetical protein SpCBS45565_g05303 [Spizellomyces sp. 'palustris']